METNELLTLLIPQVGGGFKTTSRPRRGSSSSGDASLKTTTTGSFVVAGGGGSGVSASVGGVVGAAPATRRAPLTRSRSEGAAKDWPAAAHRPSAKTHSANRFEHIVVPSKSFATYPSLIKISSQSWRLKSVTHSADLPFS